LTVLWGQRGPGQSSGGQYRWSWVLVLRSSTSGSGGLRRCVPGGRAAGQWIRRRGGDTSSTRSCRDRRSAAQSNPRSDEQARAPVAPAEARRGYFPERYARTNTPLVTLIESNSFLTMWESSPFIGICRVALRVRQRGYGATGCLVDWSTPTSQRPEQRGRCPRAEETPRPERS
jgi:hypothetical protein